MPRLNSRDKLGHLFSELVGVNPADECNEKFLFKGLANEPTFLGNGPSCVRLVNNAYKKNETN